MAESISPQPLVRIEKEGRFAGRRLFLPDRPWGRTFEIIDFRIVGPRVLVKTSRAPGSWRYYAVALTLGADKAAFPHYHYVGSMDDSMVADVKAGTDIGILPDSIEAVVLPSGAVVNAANAPFSVLETPKGFVVIPRYSKRKEHPRNVFMYGFDGSLVWQIEDNPIGPNIGHGHCFMENGRLICTPFDLFARVRIRGYEIDMDTGKVLSEVRSD